MVTHREVSTCFCAMVMCWMAARLPAAEVAKALPKGTAARLERRLPFHWESMTVFDALRQLEEKTGCNLELVGEVTEGRQDQGDGVVRSAPYRHMVHMELKDVRAWDVLEMLCAMSGLRVEMRDEVVRVLKPEVLPIEMEIYPVDDLVLCPPTATADSARMNSYGEWDNRQPPAASNPFVAAGSPALTAANVADMIRAHVAPESWDPANGTSIEERSGRLVVMQTARVHERIRRLLTDFRGTYRRRVDLEVRLVQLSSADTERLIQSARTRGNPVGLLDRAAVEHLDELLRQNAAQRIYLGSTTLEGDQGGVLRQTQHRRFISSYTMIEGQPEPGVLNVGLGTSLWLCPWLSADGRHLRLGLRTGWQELAGEPQSFEVMRGGLIVSREGTQKITVKRKPVKPGDPNAQQPAAPPNGAADEDKELKDVTDEYEFDIEEKLPTQTVTENLQVFLPTLARADLRLDLDMPVDTYGYATMPATNREGPVPGHEFLVVVRGHPVARACPEAKVVAPPYPDEIAGKLTREFEMRFDGVKLEKALSDLSEKTGLSMAIDYGRVSGIGDRAVAWSGGRAPAAKVLADILRQAECEARAFGTMLLVVPAQCPYAMRIYDIRDMATCFDQTRLWAFPPLPAVARTAKEGESFAVRLNAPSLCAPELAQLVRERLMPDRFSDARSSIEEQGGRLIVMQTPENHELVGQHLMALRRKSMTSVQLTARWLTVEKEELGREVPASMDGPQTARLLDVLSRPGTRVLGTTRLTSYAGQLVYSFGSLMVSQIAGYVSDGESLTPSLFPLLNGTGYEFRTIAQNEARLPGAVEEICVEARSYLSAFGPYSPLQDPLVSDNDKPRSVSPDKSAKPGPIQSAAGCQVTVDTVLRIPDGGAALTTYSVPDWLSGEPEDPAKRAGRVLVLLVQAERRK